jgi:hypothetical protein
MAHLNGGPKDPVEHAPVVHTRNAARLVRQEMHMKYLKFML